VDSLLGHCGTESDANGDPVQVHCGPCEMTHDYAAARIAALEARLAAAEAAQREAEERVRVLTEDRPRIVCLCGSSRFRREHEQAAMAETLAGRIVVGMGLFGHDDHPAGARAITCDGDESTAVKQQLDWLHFRKIDLADEVLVLNVGGYIGSSTSREVCYAMAQGKGVRLLERPPRVCDGHEPWHCDENCWRRTVEAALAPATPAGEGKEG
jgi:hypothetical protein